MAKTPRSTPLGSTRKAPVGAPSAASRQLAVFAHPSPDRDYVIQFVIPEFTCNCPLTGQPDFAHFTIDMVADALCVELKSLKLYFWSYRDVGRQRAQALERIGVQASKQGIHVGTARTGRTTWRVPSSDGECSERVSVITARHAAAASSPSGGAPRRRSCRCRRARSTSR